MNHYKDELLRIVESWTVEQLEKYIEQLEERIKNTREQIVELNKLHKRKTRKVVDTGTRGGV